MSLRANRLKYSMAGENVSMTAAASAAAGPRRALKSHGMATRAEPAAAYRTRAVTSPAPKTKKSAAVDSNWNGPCIMGSCVYPMPSESRHA